MKILMLVRKATDYIKFDFISCKIVSKKVNRLLERL